MIFLVIKLWKKWLLQSNTWIPTITFIPLLYAIGWVIAKPFNLIWTNLQSEDISLIGTFFTFILFLLLLPSWVIIRWGNKNPYFELGIKSSNSFRSILYFSKGFLEAIFLIFLILLLCWYGSWIESFEPVSSSILINGIVLGIGVGLAEELVFRGWLLGELNNLLGPRIGIICQAAIFSTSHITIYSSLNEMFSVGFGLFVFGVLLGLKRNLDKGSLWGCIALHGGLVGTWFVISNEWIEFASNISHFLIGPDSFNPNPIGGLFSILMMSLFIFYQRKALIKG